MPSKLDPCHDNPVSRGPIWLLGASYPKTASAEVTWHLKCLWILLIIFAERKTFSHSWISVPCWFFFSFRCQADTLIGNHWSHAHEAGSIWYRVFCSFPMKDVFFYSLGSCCFKWSHSCLFQVSLLCVKVRSLASMNTTVSLSISSDSRVSKGRWGRACFVSQAVVIVFTLTWLHCWETAYRLLRSTWQHCAIHSLPFGCLDITRKYD